MPERRHGAALDKADSGRARLPGRQPLPWKLRPPAEPPRERCEGLLAELAQAAFGADVVHQNDLTAGFQHPRELIECRLRVRHRGDDVLGYDHVERVVRKRKVLRVHDGQRLDIGKSVLGDALGRLAQHRRRDVDADDTVGARIVGQRNAGADTDFENASADALRRRDRGAAAALEHPAEHHIVDRRPARIGLRYCRIVELGHGFSSRSWPTQPSKIWQLPVWFVDDSLQSFWLRGGAQLPSSGVGGVAMWKETGRKIGIVVLVLIAAAAGVLGLRWLTSDPLQESTEVVNLEDEWANTIRKIGIDPVFPPEEDLTVGDVLAVVVKDNKPDAEGDAKITAQTPLPKRAIKLAHVDVREALTKSYELLL